MTAYVLARPGLIASPLDPVPGQAVRLAASTCASCSRPEFPARPQCPACGASATTEGLPEHAVLAGYTTVLHPPPGAQVAVPYHVGIARYSNGLCILGLLDAPVDIALELGMDLVTIATEPSPGALTYAFRLA